MRLGGERSVIATMVRSTLTCASILSATLGAAAGTGVSPLEQAFQDFMQKYQRVYNDMEEGQYRLAVFKKNFLFVHEMNTKDLPYQLAINEFADEDPEEFKQTRFGMRSPGAHKLWAGATYLGRHNYTGEELASSLDWVDKGAVTGVKDQGRCGSCWAFSSTGGLEGAAFVAGHELMSLSEQQLMDCAKNGNLGCRGGGMEQTFSWYEGHGACSETSYPYTGTDTASCKLKCSVVLPKGSVTGYKDVKASDEKALMSALMKQPVSVAIEADQLSFQFYSGGVLTGLCGTNLDHGVLLVGYGTDAGHDYWKLKNSWGAGWGEKGFLRIQRGGKGAAGQCGIALDPSYPVVKKAARAQLVV